MNEVNVSIMNRVLQFAKRSPDPSTQNAAVLGNEFELFEDTFSVNEFPRYVRYSDERWERPLKYEFIEHAERNAIYAAAKHAYCTSGSTLYCAWAACSDCARAIIQAGITRLVTLEPQKKLTNERWDTSVNVGMTMLDEAGVEVRYLPNPKLDLTLLRNGNKLSFNDIYGD